MRGHYQVRIALLFIGIAGVCGFAQIRYTSGQNVGPVFEGWQRNPDGSFSLVFGYLNRNYEEEIDIPIGPNNNIVVGAGEGGDRGQPEHFYPRRQRFLFKVVVPKDWDQTQRVVWTLTSHGRTDRAKGWLQPEWELNDEVVVENMGGGVPDPNNQAPSLRASDSQVVTLPDTATLTASASDDGLPKPYQRTPASPDHDAASRRPRGVQIKWIQYRGPDKVTFDPDSSEIVYGKAVELKSKASFGAPGTYVLRVTASDGQLYSSRDVTVIVKPGK